MVDHARGVMRSAFHFMSGTFLSRISGLVRDMSMAFCFGTDPAIAGFLVAFRFANLLRRIFGEGSLQTSFIPHFESYRTGDPKRAAQFFRDLFFSLAVILTVIIIVVEVGLYYGSIWEGLSANNLQIINLTRVMLPSILFICLFTLCAGLLQCEGRFFLTGGAPIVFNAVWIASVFLFKEQKPEKAVEGLAWAVTLALSVQWIVTLPRTVVFLRSLLSWRELLHFRCFSSEVRKMAASMSLGVVAVGASQINSAIDTLFARYASLEGPAYLNYAIHLYQLPLALFGIGFASSLLPALSRAAQSNNMQKYKELLGNAFLVTLLFLLPCTFAIFALGGSSVNLIFGRGDFNNFSTVETTSCLFGYGVGLIPAGLALLLGPAFFAQKNYRIPTYASLISIALNLLLNFILVFFLHWGPASLAISTSCAAYCNAGILMWKLAENTSLPWARFVLRKSIKLLLCVGVASILTIAFGVFCLDIPTCLQVINKEAYFSRVFAIQMSDFFTLALVFVGTFFVAARSLNLIENSFTSILFQELGPDSEEG